MILTSSTHNHSTLCDGKNTPREMAETALAAGFTDLGFSSHSRAPFDPAYSIRDEAEYVRILRALQEEYAGRLRISVGLEQDFYAPVENRAALDYIVGSVHYLRDDAGTYYAVDGNEKTMDACIQKMFGGDALAMARAYYALVAENARRYRPEIIGHFDLVKKNNQGNRLFCEDDPAYRAAALEALGVCVDMGAVIELNTGGILRCGCSEPYPARFLLEALCARGARVTVNGDAHRTNALTFWFDEALSLLRDVGFGSVAVWENGAFVDKPL